MKALPRSVVLRAVLAVTPCSAQEIVVKNGQKVAFLGDLVTRWRPTGYAQQVMRGPEANGVKADMILGGNAGAWQRFAPNGM